MKRWQKILCIVVALIAVQTYEAVIAYRWASNSYKSGVYIGGVNHINWCVVSSDRVVEPSGDSITFGKGASEIIRCEPYYEIPDERSTLQKSLFKPLTPGHLHDNHVAIAGPNGVAVSWSGNVVSIK